MCGIAGIVGTERRDRLTLMRAMRDALVHRGPDSAGEHVSGQVALGVRRLRVIDLVRGDMPIANEGRTVWTVYNGEIYNFQTLREELRARGHTFSTASDTEVIVHLYEDRGPEFVRELDGMFAIALWDERTQRLVLARDRLGKKPLLYWERHGELGFASEHAALLASLPDRTVDREAVRLYLRLGYVPAPRDAFSAARKLPPAHYLVWSGGRSSLHRYWSLPAPGRLRISEPDAITELRRLTRAAVARRLVADVPIGAFLSGGVDSSVVVATMAELTTDVRTFTIDFGESAYSEAAHARRVAERFGTEHHEFVVDPRALDVLPTLVRHYGEPYADSSAVPTYYLSQLTRRHVTVALNGDGGDELFAGYERYFAARVAAALDVVPSGLRSLGSGIASLLLPDSIDPRSRSRRMRRFIEAAALPRRERYLRWVGVFDTATLSRILSDEFGRSTDAADRELFDEEPDYQTDAVTEAQYQDVRHYLPDDLLVKVDIASMANSLEVRSPLLDREIVEFALSLPVELRMRGADRKYLLKRAFADVVPAENMYRRKQGFALPIGEWFRTQLRELLCDTLLSRRAMDRAYFRQDAVEALVRSHLDGSADHTHRLWSLLFLELWHREFVDVPALSAAVA